MSDPAQDPAVHDGRTARRLERLFRIERRGGFERRPIETVRRLIERRATLVDELGRELARLETARRAPAAPLPAGLAAALDELAREVGAAQRSCAARIEWLAGELRLRDRENRVTGLRGSGAGQLLGSS